MNANDRLQAARTAMTDERYEEALAHVLWYHDHSLAEDRSCAGVRLSFALHDWLELAERYPPALAAFHARRDAKAADLRAGRLDRDLFKDVAAMGGMIGQDALVADLFSELHEAYPAFACQCAPIALPFLVRTGRFALARHYLPDPVLHMRQRAGELVRDVAGSVSRPAITAPRYRAEVRNFVDDLQDVLRILRATGAHALAEETRQEALMQLEPEALRKAVSRRLARLQGPGAERSPSR